MLLLTTSREEQMRAENARQVAAGKVLDVLGPEARIERIRVDGAEVAPEKARAAFAAATDAAAHAGNGPGVFDRFTDKIETQLDKLEESLRKTKTGGFIADFLRSDPEAVRRTVTVDVELKNGERLSLPVTVSDPRVTTFLQRLSLTAELAALVPIVGTFALGAASLASAVASVLSFGIGNRPLGSALARTAAKHAILAGADIVPVLGDAAAALAAVIDNANLKKMRQAPSVADIVNLGA
jgi:hypothetical protein